MDVEQLNHRFAYHPPTDPLVAQAHGDIRVRCVTLAREIDRLVPEGREKSLAITNLEQVMMWANAGIARNRPTVEREAA